MAKDDVNEEQDDQDEATAKSSSNMKVIIIAVLAAVLLSGAVVGATLYFVTGMDSEKSTKTEDGEETEDEDEEIAEEESEPLEPPKYHSLNPKFVVSFRDQRVARFMQFEIDLMTRSDDTIMKINNHMPAVRSSLLMLFDGQDYAAMSTSEGKKQLLIEVTNNVNKTVDEMAVNSDDDSAVEAAYFTSFVIQ